MLIGLAGVVLFPNIEPTNVFPHLVLNLLPVGMKGLAIAGALAVSMSTIDSYLHVSGLTFTHDVLKPLCDRRNITINELKWAKASTLIIGLLAILLGTVGAGASTDEILGFALTALGFTGPILMFPLLSGIMGLKTDKRAFYTALPFTLLAFLLSELFLPENFKHLGLLISIFTNGVFFFGTHFAQHNGFVIVHREEGIRKEELLQLHPTRSFFNLLSTCAPTPANIVQYSKNKIEKYGAPYLLFGLFCCVSSTVPYFMWTQTTNEAYHLMLPMRMVTATLGGLLLVQEKWPKVLHKYFPAFFHFTLLYSLPFMSTVMFLITHGSIEWVINITIAIFFLILLADWLTFFVLSGLGVALGCLFYTQAVGPITLQLDFSTAYLLTYQIIFATIIGLLFGRRKQQSFDTLASEKKRITIEHQETQEELVESQQGKANMVKMVEKAGMEDMSYFAETSKELLEILRNVGSEKDVGAASYLTDSLAEASAALDRFEHRAIGYLPLEDVRKMDLPDLFREVGVALEARAQKVVFRISPLTPSVQCDVKSIKKLLITSAAFVHKMGESEGPVLLATERTTLGYQFDEESMDEIKTVDAICFTITTATQLPKVRKRYIAQMDWQQKAAERVEELLLLRNEQLLKAHYGYTAMETVDGVLTLYYVIPINIREVRAERTEIPTINGRGDWPHADDNYPGANDREEAFLEEVWARTKADLQVVERAIEVLKDYHGPTRRSTGEPFYLHALEVARIVMDYTQDETTLLAALLHDTIAKTPLTPEQLTTLFNFKVSNIVKAATNMLLREESAYTITLTPVEHVREMVKRKDERVLYIKVADKLHDMRTLQGVLSREQLTLVNEVLSYYSPIAQALGMKKVVEEFTQRAQDVLDRLRNV
jgi:Na+/proline symporter